MKAATTVKKSPHPRIDWRVQPLGQEPDSRIASRLGVSYHVVATARWRLKIPSHRATRVRLPIDFPLPHLKRMVEIAEYESWRAREGGLKIDREDGVQEAMLSVLELCVRGVVTVPQSWLPFARIVMRNALRGLKRKQPTVEQHEDLTAAILEDARVSA